MTDAYHLQDDERTSKNSFAQILKGTIQSGDVSIREPTVLCNKPAVVFSEAEEIVLTQHFNFALVGKFSRGLPVFKSIHPALVNLGLKGSFTVGALKPGYVLINLSLEEDFARLWVRQEWLIAGKPMRLFKWSPSFTYSVESAIAPVWISLPDLLIHLFSKGALYSVTSTIGKPAKIDEATANRSRPSVARVCVEVDLRKNNVPSIIIKSGQNTYEQKVFYEDKPEYCSLCYHRGHKSESCFSNGNNQPPNRQQNQRTTLHPKTLQIPETHNQNSNRAKNGTTETHWQIITRTNKPDRNTTAHNISQNPQPAKNLLPNESNNPSPKTQNLPNKMPLLQNSTHSPLLLLEKDHLTNLEEGQSSNLAEDCSELLQLSPSIAHNPFSILKNLAEIELLQVTTDNKDAEMSNDEDKEKETLMASKVSHTTLLEEATPISTLSPLYLNDNPLPTSPFILEKGKINSINPGPESPPPSNPTATSKAHLHNNPADLSTDPAQLSISSPKPSSKPLEPFIIFSPSPNDFNPSTINPINNQVQPRIQTQTQNKNPNFQPSSSIVCHSPAFY